MLFDARAAKLLQPGQHLTIDGCPGLRLVASGSLKTWTYRYKAADGRMKQVRLGHWPGMPAPAAVAAWQALRDGKTAGVDPRGARQKPTPAPAKTYAVRDLVADYLAGHIDASRAPAGALAARRMLDAALAEAPTFASTPAAEVTRAQAFDLLEERKGKPTAAQKLRSLLGSAWDYALDSGRLPGDAPNWWRLVQRGRLKSKGKVVGGAHVGPQRRVLRAGEIAELLRWLPNMHALGRDGVLMYLWTCARGVEIFGMRPEHITQEADGWWWTVPVVDTKNARHAHAVDLRVPLEGQALAVVQRRLQAVGPSGWLFETERKGERQPYTQHFFSTYVYSLQPYSEKVGRRAGQGLVLPVSGWTPHDLRRTSRTLLASLGCPNEVGEAIVGHLPPVIVATYNAHSYDAERRYWLTKLSAHLAALPGLPARP